MNKEEIKTKEQIDKTIEERLEIIEQILKNPIIVKTDIIDIETMKITIQNND